MIVTLLLIVVGLGLIIKSRFMRMSRCMKNNERYYDGAKAEEANTHYIGFALAILGFIVGATLGI